MQSSQERCRRETILLLSWYECIVQFFTRSTNISFVDGFVADLQCKL